MKVPCAGCGLPIYWNKNSSRPVGESTCRACRRLSPRPYKAQSKAKPPRQDPGTEATCQRCGQVFVRTIARQRLCWNPCQKRRSGSNKSATATERGYDSAHQRAREAAKAAWQNGDPCARCGGPMYHGTPVDLDHTDDRTGYLGLSHASCNRSSTGRLQAVKVRLSCEHCNLPYESRWAEQRYCSSACRTAARPAPRAPVRRPTLRLTPCSECLVLFVTKQPHQVTCSPACRKTRADRQYRERYEPAPSHQYECACCGIPCTSTYSRARFCSPECNKRASKRRANGKPERSPVLDPRRHAPRAA